MATPILAGFDANAYTEGGGLGVTIRRYLSDVLQGTTNVSITYSTGGPTDYRSHVGFESWQGGASLYTSIAVDLEVAFGGDPITVSFDPATGLYSFEPTTPGEEIELDFFLKPVKSQDLLGFPDANTTTTRAATVTSTATVPYWFDCTHGLGEYKEDTDQTEQPNFRATNGGHIYGLGDGNSAVLMDFVVKAEEQAKVFDWKAAADAYTLQAHYEHCRWRHPFLVYHEFGTALHTFQPEKANFRHRRFFENNDSHWDVPFSTYVART